MKLSVVTPAEHLPTAANRGTRVDVSLADPNTGVGSLLRV
jgi:hypothetical protein